MKPCTCIYKPMNERLSAHHENKDPRIKVPSQYMITVNYNSIKISFLILPTFDSFFATSFKQKKSENNKMSNINKMVSK